MVGVLVSILNVSHPILYCHDGMICLQASIFHQGYLAYKKPTCVLQTVICKTYCGVALAIVEKCIVSIKYPFILKGRSSEVPDNIVDKFEDRAKTFTLGLDVIFQYPDYGEKMDK